MNKQLMSIENQMFVIRNKINIKYLMNLKTTDFSSNLMTKILDILRCGIISSFPET